MDRVRINRNRKNDQPTLLRPAIQRTVATLLFVVAVSSCSRGPRFEKALPELDAEFERAQFGFLKGATIVTRTEGECVPSKKSTADRALDKLLAAPREESGNAGITIKFTSKRSDKELSESFRSEAARLGFTEQGELVGSFSPNLNWAENHYRPREKGRTTFIFMNLADATPDPMTYFRLYIPCDDLRK